MEGDHVKKRRHQSQIEIETTSLLPPIIIGVALILVNAYWIALVSGIHHSLNPAYASLFIAPIVNLFFLSAHQCVPKADSSTIRFKSCTTALSLSDVGHALRGLRA